MIGLAALDPNNPAANITTDPNAGIVNVAWCDLTSFLSAASDYCQTPSQSDITAYVAQEMAGTALTPANQAAAQAAGNAAIGADQVQNPANYIAQCAAANYPTLTGLFGSSLVGSAVGCKVDGTTSLLSGWGIYALAIAGFVAFMEMRK